MHIIILVTIHVNPLSQLNNGILSSDKPELMTSKAK